MNTEKLQLSIRNTAADIIALKLDLPLVESNVARRTIQDKIIFLEARQNDNFKVLESLIKK